MWFLSLPVLTACRQNSGKFVNRSNTNDSLIIQPDLNKKVNNASDSGTNLINCQGVAQVKFSDNLNGLIDKFGKDNITIDSLMLEGTYEETFSTIHKSKIDEIKVFWKEKQPPFETMKAIEISNPKSPFRFSNSIGIGSSIQEIEKLNEGVFQFYGFGWDYGGTLISFNNGKLEKDFPCFKAVFQMQQQKNTPSSDPSVMGDHPVQSDHPNLKNYRVVIKKIRIVKT
ncbi:hypothetical protein [Daejeonella oryzae]|uniref:hypothetical protein n=1 Tax=Daejeonella oryzae TaxID=1122943 RepID=UPI0012DF03DC|nr:hypothetical protein [Daejeonella oryzae]